MPQQEVALLLVAIVSLRVRAQPGSVDYCPGDTVWSTCHGACPRVCDLESAGSFFSPCPSICVEGCGCGPFGNEEYLHLPTQKCYASEDLCPRESSCVGGTRYLECHSACE